MVWLSFCGPDKTKKKTHRHRHFELLMFNSKASQAHTRKLYETTGFCLLVQHFELVRLLPNISKVRSQPCFFFSTDFYNVFYAEFKNRYTSCDAEVIQKSLNYRGKNIFFNIW